MKKILITLFAIIFLSCNLKLKKNRAQNKVKDNALYLKVEPKPFIEDLPGKLMENSGIIYYDDLLWSFNDSGGSNKIYGFGFSGKIKKEVEIEDADNRDWEDITHDKKYIYVGDFGNNNSNRGDLKIYRIKKKDIGKKKEQKVNSKEIKFKYTPQKKNKSLLFGNAYDCEAMLEFKGNLYIFTKDRSDYTTTVYKIPTEPDKYEVSPISKFDVNGLVTGADISKDKTKLALVGYNRYQPFVWLFSNISEQNFFTEDRIHMELTSIFGAQTEGICFIGNDSILISCERNRNFLEQVFLIDLKAIDR